MVSSIFINISFMKFSRYLIILLVSTSCAVSFSDMKQNLGNGYYYLGEGQTQSYIYLSFDKKAPSIDKISVWPTVLAYDYNENFVIVKQSPNETVIRQNLIYFNNETEVSVDSILKIDEFFIDMLSYDTCYWIIDKRKQVLNGPYNYFDYEKERVLLGISKKLILK